MSVTLPSQNAPFVPTVEGKAADATDGLDAGQCPDLANSFLELSRVVEASAGSRVCGRESCTFMALSATIAGIDVEQGEEAASEQAGADQQGGRQRGLADQQRCAQGELGTPGDWPRALSRKASVVERRRRDQQHGRPW